MSDQQKPVGDDKAVNKKSVGATKGEGGMSESDMKFLVECLKHTKGNVIVDLDKVAEALEYNNPKSVGNRLTNLRKKYGLALNTSAASTKNADAVDVASSPIKAGKARKPRTPKKAGESTPRKKPATPRKGKKAAETNDEDEDIMNATTANQDVKMDHGDEDPGNVKEALEEEPSSDNIPTQSQEASQCSEAED